ncbi:hypothetical protein TNCV_3057091 [Trichonephila clavipes]|nr:hypothetical protein TNCV_3057091 [Trichonephila clavipes]
MCTTKYHTGAYINVSVKHPSQRREGLQHKHSCLTRDSNPDPMAPQSASLNTIPDWRQWVGLLSSPDHSHTRKGRHSSTNKNEIYCEQYLMPFDGPGTMTMTARQASSPVLSGTSVVDTRAHGDRFNSCQVIYSQFGLAIHQNDHQARRRFVEWAQNEIAVVSDFHKRILFSDEAHFWLNGYVNKQNCRIWSEANPQVYVETPLHPEKLTVWCALWAGGILLQKRCRPQRYSQW